MKRDWNQIMNNHPELEDIFDELIDIKDNKASNLANAHVAEEETTRVVRKLGNAVISGWAEKAGQQEAQSACALKKS